MRSSRASYVIVALVFVVVMVVDMLTPRGQSIRSLLTVVPLVMAVDGSRREVVLSAAVAMVPSLYLSWYHVTEDGVQNYANAVGIVFATVIGLYVQQRRVVREARLERVTRVADAAQYAILSPPNPRVGPLDVAASYMSAVREANVGGDFYKVIATQWGVRAIIGDVRGKGLPAVRAASTALSVFREAAHDERHVADIAPRMEQSLRRDAGLEDFVTALMLHVSGDGGCVALSYGHPPPLLRTATGAVRELAMTSGLPLGIALVDNPLGPGESTVRLAEGDELLLVTDGVLEARGPDGAFYPLTERYARMPLGLAPQEVLTSLRQDLAAYSDTELADDSAIVLMRFHPQSRPERPGGHRARELPSRAPGPTGT